MVNISTLETQNDFWLSLKGVATGFIERDIVFSETIERREKMKYILPDLKLVLYSF